MYVLVFEYEECTGGVLGLRRCVKESIAGGAPADSEAERGGVVEGEF